MGLGYLDFTVGQVPTAAQFDGYLMRQTMMTFATDAARDSDLSTVLDEGMVCYTEDNNRIYVYTGAAWDIVSEPPQSWTPVVTQGVGVSASAIIAWYQRSRGVFTAQVFFQCNSTGTASNTITVSTPLTLANTEYIGGSALVYDNTTSILFFEGYVTPSSTTLVVLSQAGATAATGIGNNPSVQLENNNQIRLTMTGRYA